MNQRMTVAAIVMLLAAGILTRNENPEFVAAVGTYVAVSQASGVITQRTLTLRDDATVALESVRSDSNKAVVETGGWVVDGGAVQIALSSPTDPGDVFASTLLLQGDTLVGAVVDGPESRFSGLTFRRASVPANSATKS